MRTDLRVRSLVSFAGEPDLALAEVVAAVEGGDRPRAPDRYRRARPKGSNRNGCEVVRSDRGQRTSKASNRGPHRIADIGFDHLGPAQRPGGRDWDCCWFWRGITSRMPAFRI